MIISKPNGHALGCSSLLPLKRFEDSFKDLGRSDISAAVNQQLDRVLNSFFADDFLAGVKSNATYPKMDAVVEDDKLKLRYTVPGVKAEDIDVQIIRDHRAGSDEHYPTILEVSGRLSSEHISEQNAYKIRELSSSQFKRQVALPDSVEGEPEATLRDGILTLVFQLRTGKDYNPKEVKKIAVKTE